MKHLEVGGEKHYIVEKIKELSKTTSYVSKEINCKWETIYNIYVCYNCQENWFSDNTLEDIYILLSIMVFCPWSIANEMMRARKSRSTFQVFNIYSRLLLRRQLWRRDGRDTVTNVFQKNNDREVSKNIPIPVKNVNLLKLSPAPIVNWPGCQELQVTSKLFCSFSTLKDLLS